MKKFLIAILTIIVVGTGYSFVKTALDNSSKNHLKYNQTSSSELDYSELVNSSYEDYYYYLMENDMHFPENAEFKLKAIDFSDASNEEFRVLSNYEGKNNVLLTPEMGEVSYEVNIPEAGYYNLGLSYFPYEGKGTNIERTIKINNEIPYNGTKNVIIYRFWGSEGEIQKDIFDNDIRPSQIEKPRWSNITLKDPVGYVNENFAYYFESGINTITFVSEAEPLVIDEIVVKSADTLQTYEDVTKQYLENGYQEVDGKIEIVEAESLNYTTSPTLYPLSDPAASTSPTSPTKVRLNTVGGDNWRIAGDKIVWNFEVDETGLYEISLRVRQQLATGMNSNRNIYINGEIPFQELKDYSFSHNNAWRIQTLGTNDEAFKFYFEAGQTYEFAMEVSLGQYGVKIAQIENTINVLSALYRQILVFTGPDPDPNLDYQLTTRIPDLLDKIEEQLIELTQIREDIYNISGSRSEKTGIIDTLIVQLEDFLKKPSTIHRKLTAFNNNISSLGTLIILLTDQPLELDYLVLSSGEVKMPKNAVNPIKSLLFSVRSFFSTFTTDYASVGKTTDEDLETIDVWLTIGRDQANILRRLIDESFTPVYDIQVNLNLVSGASLLPATLSGKGPDVALGVDYNTPVNYGLRTASYDLTQFDDFDTVVDRFMPSAFVPFTYDDAVYGLPEQQIFLMMFYRIDIFEELNLPIPNTWDDVIKIIPDLQKYNLEFYLPVPRTQGAVTNLPPNPVFSTMFYQNDGQFYINNNTESGLNEGKGPEVFETWTQFYNDYSFPVEANFPNRFRSGQMPLGITYYNIYNTLSVFAPEIRGKWGFLPVPGTEYIDENGDTQIRRDTVSTTTASMILNDSTRKDSSWEFLKWWTSVDVQVRFGREMEGILGAAARYPTANIEAMERLPWRANELELLKSQWEEVVGIPEVPGSYMTGRHIDNAFRMVINDKANPREVIYDYVQTINEEIRKKRDEFGLD